ncbi:recombinase family protein [Mesorhizobium sp. PAMC28654]|uniref:recombinase family protein n=1 Tax=Mesorhizobium sp. PAMC28654 TaxID=2880934 RepID=UPI001D0B3160|nr:recombinase family protein [Mesorhizobium sp. PAMC28654]UDL88391.1 recombinase family protein [Mesorhizobium sp. PAMC28654]
MLTGYARTSTTDQTAGLEAQLVALKAAGCEKIFSEHASGAKQRDQLDEALRFLREGDTLLVTKMDRLARDLRTLLAVVDDLDKRGIGLRILDFAGETINTRSATGRLQLAMFAAFAEFERTMMLERQRAGIEKAKSEGKYTGRKPSAMTQQDAIKSLASDGLTRAAIAAQLGISERSVYRALT